THRRSPNTLVTMSPLTATMVPAGTVIGTRNQSFENTRPNSMNKSFPRSVVSGRMAPKFVRPSSMVHQRGCGMPAYVTGVGIVVRVNVAGAPVAPRAGALGSTSNTHQSTVPKEYSSATSFRSPPSPGAAQAKRYSKREGFQAGLSPPDGRDQVFSAQAMNVRR